MALVPVQFFPSFGPVLTEGDRVIRRAEERNLAVIVDIENAAYTAPWTYSSFHYELQHPLATFYVLEVAGCLGGYVAGWIVSDAFHLHNLTVVPKLQRSGCGALLLEALHVQSERIGLLTVELEVRSTNVRALAFYRRYGYRTVGIRPGYYRSPVEDAILMNYAVENARKT